MTIMTSCGFTAPRLAWLSVRMRVMVITMVTRTTRVAPKLRASSLRKDEWNNIGAAAIREKPRIMDFELKTFDLADACRQKCDALVALVTDEGATGDDPISRLVQDARKSGDFESKA